MTKSGGVRKPGANSRKYTVFGVKGNTRATKEARKQQDRFNREVKTRRCIVCLKPRPSWTYPIHDECIRSR